MATVRHVTRPPYLGWKSTKLHKALLAEALITIVYGYAGFPADQFGAYCTAIVALVGVYSGTSAAEKFSAGANP